MQKAEVYQQQEAKWSVLDPLIHHGPISLMATHLRHLPNSWDPFPLSTEALGGWGSGSGCQPDTSNPALLLPSLS
jgi:hypothetical protein